MERSLELKTEEFHAIFESFRENDQWSFGFCQIISWNLLKIREINAKSNISRIFFDISGKRAKSSTRCQNPQCPSKLTLVHTFGQITGILIWSSIHRMYMCRKMFVMMTLLRLLLIETKVGAPLILEVSTLIFTHDSTQPSGGNANVFEKKIPMKHSWKKNSEN